MNIHCPFCGATDGTKAVVPRPTVFNGTTFSYQRCKSCGLVFIDPMPAPGDYAKMYSPEYHQAFYFKDQLPSFDYLAPVMEKYKTDGTLLDYGCGDASFLRFFSGKGYKTEGVEFDPALVKELQENFPDSRFISVADFQNELGGRKYNFAHLGDVLEHLEDPVPFLTRLKQVLQADSGILIVEGPLENNGSLAYTCRYLTSWLTGRIKNKPASHVPYHITFSNKKNQLALFERLGLQTIQFKVFETSWPYPDKPGRSPGSVVKFLIGKISIGLSSLLPFMKTGNRFIYVGRNPAQFAEKKS